MSNTRLTAERLRELLDYDPETGIFTYKTKRGIQLPGSIAGSKMVRGNWSIGLECRRHSAHRLAWLYMTGKWPTLEIDHIDNNPLNNSWANLREVTSGQNSQNLRAPRKDNRSGYLGVYRHGKNKRGDDVWRSRIQVEGKVVHLGLFPSPELAHEAYVAAKRTLHPYGNL